MLINTATIRIHKYLRKIYAFKNILYFFRFLCDFSFSVKIMKKTTRTKRFYNSNIL